MLCQVVGLHHDCLNNNVWAYQVKKGAHAIFDGRLSTEWAQEQDEYLVDVKLWAQRTNDSQWTVQ
eukprot:10591884-Ditylum_brightwellii.AAC.1